MPHLRLETTSWKWRFEYGWLYHWFRLSFFSHGLAPLTMGDDFQPTWKLGVVSKIWLFSICLLFRIRYEQAQALIKQCITDTEHQVNLDRSTTFIANDFNSYSASSVTYLTKFEVLQVNLGAFILAQCQLSLKANI